jgi:hypothetical protein
MQTKDFLTFQNSFYIHLAASAPPFHSQTHLKLSTLQREYIALRECAILGIPTISLVDTNCDGNFLGKFQEEIGME